MSMDCSRVEMTMAGGWMGGWVELCVGLTHLKLVLASLSGGSGVEEIDCENLDATKESSQPQPNLRAADGASRCAGDGGGCGLMAFCARPWSCASLSLGSHHSPPAVSSASSTSPPGGVHLRNRTILTI